MRRFINGYGEITDEYKRSPDKFCPSYRKGSYFATFDSRELGLCCSVGDIDKYTVYKELVKAIKNCIKGVCSMNRHL